MSKAKPSAAQRRCSRCNEPGAHYVPPGFGSGGFYMCDPDDKPDPNYHRRYYLHALDDDGTTIVRGQD